MYVSRLLQSRENIYGTRPCLLRIELTRVCSLNEFQLVMGLYRGHPLFFLECVYSNLLFPY